MRALLAAGGTGGHLFPAEALAGELARRNHTVALLTDARAGDLLADFPAEEIGIISSGTPSGRRVGAMAKAFGALGLGLVQSIRIMRRFKPDVAVGFGGYPTLPPLTAAKLLGIPAIVHEANAVAGRANRRLAKGAHVATSFPEVKGLEGARSVERVGMPVRAKVRQAAASYTASKGPFRLVVFGGSQGARAFADIVPPAVARLEEGDRTRLSIVQQCRPEDMDRVREAYAAADVTAELAPFFTDLPAKMAAAHLVIARSGAGTVAELSVIGRPAFLVPLPGAIDQDQAHNASALAALGAARRLDQGLLSPERLAHELKIALNAPQDLAEAAEAARGLALPDAAERLADLCERVGKGRDR